jgi:hypothetical protein
MKKILQVCFVVIMMMFTSFLINIQLEQKALAASIYDMMLITRVMNWTTVNNGAGNGYLDATASAADSALGVTERNIGATNAALANICIYTVPSGCNALMVRFISLTADADFDVDVYLSTNDSLNLVKIGTLDIITGTQDVYGTSNNFADTCNVSASALCTMTSTVSAAEGCVVLEVGDLKGFDRVVFHGYGTFDENLIIQVKGY